LVSRLKKMVEENERLKRELESFKSKAINDRAKELIDSVREVNGIRVLSVDVGEAGPDELRRVWDDIKTELSSGLAVLGGKSDGKAFLLVGVTKDLSKRFHAGNMVKVLATYIGGGGGGKPDMAQAGGNKPENLDKALKKAYEIVSNA
jgi:alanyl-tRNA synthetase